MQYQRAASLTMLLIASTLGCELTPGRYGSRETYVSKCDGKEIHFPITEQDLASFPKWKPDTPSLLPTDRAVATALNELPKYSQHTDGWEIEEVSLTKVKVGNHPNDKWIYIVKFERESNHDYLQIPVTLNGTAILGQEQAPDKSR
jgi:hypothetical protein